MSSSFFRPPRKRAAGTFSSRQWQEPFLFKDGRHFAVQSATLRLYDDEDQWTPGKRLRCSSVTMSVIEEQEQCYFEFEVNFWPYDFDHGVSFEDAEWQFAYARRRIHAYLSTAHPQRGRSEYPWAIQMDYQGK